MTPERYEALTAPTPAADSTEAPPRTDDGHDGHHHVH